MAILLSAKNITRTLDEEVPVTLVRDIDLEIGENEFIAITGPSGSGKSSLLYLLGLLDRPSSGQVALENRDTATLSAEETANLRLEKLGFVFQSHYLLPEFTALENVMIPIRRLGRLDNDAARAKAENLLGDLDLKDHMHKRPRQMSGGQCQRVAIARALANDPLLVLADEPTGNLDTASSANVQDILRNLAKTGRRSVVFVTHDQDFAASASRRIHIVDGKISST